MTTIYQDAYAFLQPYLKQSLGETLYQEDFLLTHYGEAQLDLTLNTYAIDYLPAPMESHLYFYEFDHDPNSTNLAWRNNHQLYVKQFRRCLLTILGYYKTFYVDCSSYDDLASPHLFKFDDSLKGAELLDDAIISSLQEFYHTLIAIPKEEVLLSFSSCHILVETNNTEFLSFLDKIATNNGLYLHPYMET